MSEPAKVPGRGEAILVAGARGMVSSALVRRLEAGGYARVLAPLRAELDLQDAAATRAYLQREKPAYVFRLHLPEAGAAADPRERVQGALHIRRFPPLSAAGSRGCWRAGPRRNDPTSVVKLTHCAF